MEYLSQEELYMSWFLEELKEIGIINKYYYESNTFTLSKARTYPILRQMKTKTKVDQLSLLQEHVYTPDFLIEWNEKYLNSFFRVIDDEKCASKPYFFASRSKQNNKPYTFIEVKGSFDQNNMTRAFRLSQKWLYDKYDLYVQLCIIPDMFKHTFCPDRFRWTDKTLKPRTLKFTPISLNEYLAKLDI